jgi:hypothetical protein
VTDLEIRVTRSWPSGVCHFCGVLDEQVDGDRIRWADAHRSVCNQPGCLRRFRIEVDREGQRLRAANRRRTPAEVHEQIMKERRERRTAARARRKAKAA